jgi:hypothetical protein
MTESGVRMNLAMDAFKRLAKSLDAKDSPAGVKGEEREDERE